MARTQKVIPLTIYVTPAQKLMLDGITKRKRTNVSHLLREVIEAYLKYMDQAFMHPGERDIMAKLQKMEDRLVRLNLKGLHATGRIMYLVAAAWKMGHRNEPLNDETYQALMEKSKAASYQWMDNGRGRDIEKVS